MNRLVRAPVCSPVRVLILLVLLLGAYAVATAPPGAAAASRAVVVIDTGSGSRRALISFSGTISGVEALQLAGANPVLYGFAGQGAAVCALDGVGHDPTNDACLGTPSDPRYWAYFRATGGASAWTYARQCACTSTVSDGDVEGWRFGTGQAPPFASFCDVSGCAPAPTSPPAGAAPGGGGSGGTPSDSGSTAAGNAAAPTATGPGAVLGDVAPDPTLPTLPVATSPPTTVSRGDRRDRRDGGEGQALGIRSGGGDEAGDEGAGSPWGLIVAGGLAVGVATTAVVLRRRRSA